jgi:hypothetical protein
MTMTVVRVTGGGLTGAGAVVVGAASVDAGVDAGVEAGVEAGVDAGVEAAELPWDPPVLPRMLSASDVS